MSTSFEQEIERAKQQVADEAARLAANGVRFQDKGALLIKAMQETQKQIMSTFEQFQLSFKKLVEEEMVR